MPPHDGYGGGTPKPRNERADSARMKAPRPMVAMHDDRRGHVGQDVAHHDPQVAGADGPRRLDVLTFWDTLTVGPADDARGVGGAEHTEGEDDVEETGSQHGHDRQDHDEEGKGLPGVHHALDAR